MPFLSSKRSFEINFNQKAPATRWRLFFVFSGDEAPRESKAGTLRILGETGHSAPVIRPEEPAPKGRKSLTEFIRISANL
jgi:hypothetical protein